MVCVNWRIIMQTDNFKIVMIANIIIESVFYICVTAAAIYFRKPLILAWYLLFTINGYKVKETTMTKRKKRDDHA